MGNSDHPSRAAALFHQRMLELGGRYDTKQAGSLTASFEWYREWATRVLEAASSRWPNFPLTHFDYVDNPEVQAIAFRHADHHFIGIWEGVVHIVHLLFPRLLADRRVLPEIGDISEESEEPPPTIDVLTHFDELIERTGIDGVTWVIPRNATRQHYSVQLIKTAMDFLFLHELTHITNGHVDYWEALSGSPFLVELEVRPHSSTEGLMRATMEMDADCGAVSQQMGPLLKPPTVDEESVDFFRDPVKRFFWWSFAVCTLFRIFGDERIDRSEPFPHGYPPWRLRRALALSTVSTYLLERVKDGTLEEDLEDLLITEVVRAGRLVEQAFVYLTGEPPAMEGYWDAVAIMGSLGEPDNPASRLLRYWKEELRDALLPYACVKLPE